jgi:predicted nucleotidyltransferase
LLEEKRDFGPQVLIPNIRDPFLHDWSYAQLMTARIERYNSDMQQDVVLQILKQKNAEMTKQFGVKTLSIFGSVARNEATFTSDVDLLVEFNRPVGYFGLFALQDYLEKLLGCPVDLGTPDSLKPRIRERVMGELIRVT